MPKKTLRNKKGAGPSMMGWLTGTKNYINPQAAANQKAMFQQFQGFMPTISANGKSAVMNPAASQKIAGLAGNISKTFVTAGPSGEPHFVMPSENVIRANMGKWASGLGFVPRVNPGPNYQNSLTGPSIQYGTSTAVPFTAGPMAGMSMFNTQPRQATRNMNNVAKMMSRWQQGKIGGKKQSRKRK